MHNAVVTFHLKTTDQPGACKNRRGNFHEMILESKKILSKPKINHRFRVWKMVRCEEA